MVGPDGVVASSSAAGAAVDDAEPQRQPRWNDDDHREDDCGETAATAADMSDVDVVQLLTRRLSVTPPTDVHCHSGCSDVHEGRQMTTGTSTEVDFNPYFTFTVTAALKLLFYSSLSVTCLHLIPSGDWRI